MLRLRFGSGLILGLVLGIPTGALIALLLAPAPPASDHAAATTLQVQELTRKLEAAKDERQRADTQLEQFQKLAEQMTASFNNLEQRFKALQEELLQRQARDQQAPAAPVAAPPPPASAPAAALPPAAAPVVQPTAEPAMPAADAAPAPQTP
jgi:hypothetical protein